VEIQELGKELCDDIGLDIQKVIERILNCVLEKYNLHAGILVGYSDVAELVMFLLAFC